MATITPEDIDGMLEGWALDQASGQGYIPRERIRYLDGMLRDLDDAGVTTEQLDTAYDEALDILYPPRRISV